MSQQHLFRQTCKIKRTISWHLNEAHNELIYAVQIVSSLPYIISKIHIYCESLKLTNDTQDCLEISLHSPLSECGSKNYLNALHIRRENTKSYEDDECNSYCVWMKYLVICFTSRLMRDTRFISEAEIFFFLFQCCSLSTSIPSYMI